MSLISPHFFGPNFWNVCHFPERLWDQHFGLGMDVDDFIDPRPLNGFNVHMDCSHFSPKELSVKMVDGSVVVHGKHEEKQDEHGYISREFTRRYAIPENVIVEQMSSSLDANGVLTIKAPPKQQPPKEAGNETVIPIQMTHTAEVKDQTSSVTQIIIPRRQAKRNGYSRVTNDENGFNVQMDCSHFSPEELSVKMVDGSVVVHGKHEEKQDEHGYIRREFTRRYAIPENVIVEQMSSSFDANVLTIKAPPKQQPPKEAGNETVIPIQMAHTAEVKDQTSSVTQILIPPAATSTPQPTVSSTTSNKPNLSCVSVNDSAMEPESTTQNVNSPAKTIKDIIASFVGFDQRTLFEIRDFALEFKCKRSCWEVSETKVAEVLKYSESEIIEFENLNMSPESARKLKPKLKEWMKEAEKKYKAACREVDKNEGSGNEVKHSKEEDSEADSEQSFQQVLQEAQVSLATSSSENSSTPQPTVSSTTSNKPNLSCVSVNDSAMEPESKTPNVNSPAKTIKDIYASFVGDNQRTLFEIRDFALEFEWTRSAYGVKQEKVAKKVPCSQPHISNFENLNMSPESARKLIPVLEEWMKKARKKYKAVCKEVDNNKVRGDEVKHSKEEDSEQSFQQTHQETQDSLATSSSGNSSTPQSTVSSKT